MSWVDWLKGLAQRPDPGGDPGKTGRGTVRVRGPRKGGEAYAKEWVKVLEDASPNRDPSNTYTWELDTGAPQQPPAGKPRERAAAPTKKPAPAADPFDTYTWELQGGDTPDDPWGLNKTAAPQPTVKADGVNPYDTGVFDATWTGRFDQR